METGEQRTTGFAINRWGKKLAGAAKNSFLKKCNKDAALTTCETQAMEKKLAGAAKNSFLKKCEKDAAVK